MGEDLAMKSLILLLCLFLCVQYSFCVEAPKDIETPPETTNPTTSSTPASSSSPNESTSTKPNVTEANSTTPNATEAISTTPNATEAISTTPNATEAISTTPNVTEAISTTPNATEAISTTPNAPMLASTKSRLAAAKAKTTTISGQKLQILYKELGRLLFKKELLPHAPAKTAKVVSATKPKASAKDTVQTPAHGTAKTGKGQKLQIVYKELGRLLFKKGLLIHAPAKTAKVVSTTKPKASVTGGTVSSANGVSTEKGAKLKEGDKGGKGTNGIVPESMKNKTPDSSHFAVVFLVLIALLFGLYALYHNRGKIIAVVVEGRSGAGKRGGRDRYRKLDNNSEDPEARIKNSNEVYVY